jgi:hypothetical protein
MQDVILLTITTVTDDDTGIYKIGELDFGKTGYCEKFLEKGDNRKRFVEWLRWLADAAENGTSPFFPHKGTPIKEMESLHNEGEQAELPNDLA